jgi:hypothetical protein
MKVNELASDNEGNTRSLPLLIRNINADWDRNRFVGCEKEIIPSVPYVLGSASCSWILNVEMAGNRNGERGRVNQFYINRQLICLRPEGRPIAQVDPLVKLDLHHSGLLLHQVNLSFNRSEGACGSKRTCDSRGASISSLTVHPLNLFFHSLGLFVNSLECISRVLDASNSNAYQAKAEKPWTPIENVVTPRFVFVRYGDYRPPRDPREGPVLLFILSC